MARAIQNVRFITEQREYLDRQFGPKQFEGEGNGQDDVKGAAGYADRQQDIQEGKKEGKEQGRRRRVAAHRQKEGPEAKGGD